MKLSLKFKGGPGSGFHGHKGRPGEVGGSSSLDDIVPGTGLTRRQIEANKAEYFASLKSKNNQLYYHGTVASLVDSIKTHGLKTSKSEEETRRKSVFMSSDRDEVIRYLESRYVDELYKGKSVAIFAFKIKDDRKLKFDKIDAREYGSEYSYYSTKGIPADWFESVEIIQPDGTSSTQILKEINIDELMYVPIIIENG